MSERRLVRNPEQYRGYVATRDGFVPWWAAASTRANPKDWARVPQEQKRKVLNWEARLADEDARLRQELIDSAPPIRRRTPAERLKSLTDKLVAQVESFYRKTGRVFLPRSTMDAIAKEMALDGKFVDPAKLERMTQEQLVRAMQTHAKHLLRQAERK